MPTLRSLVDDQNTIWSRMQATQRDAEAGGWTAELRASWDADETRLTEVSDDIERMDRAAKLAEVDLRGVADTGGTPPGERRGADAGEDDDREYRDAFDTYIRRGMNACTPAQQQLLEASRMEGRALAHSPDTAGGYLVPDDFRDMILETKKLFGGIESLATVITTATGARLPWVTNDDTGNEGAILGENTQIGEQDMVFGEAEIGSYTYTSKLIRVPWALLQDSAFLLEPFLARKLGERIGRISARHWASGTGSGQPTGLVTGATVGVTGTGTTAISYDNLVDLEHSVEPAYRQGARYVLSDGALKTLRKLKDADGRPIWQPIPAPGFPSTINGNPYTVEWTMAGPGANAVSIIYGNIAAAYLIRVVRGVQLVVMRERYADYLQSGFFAYCRQDGMVQDANAVRAFKHAAT